MYYNTATGEYSPSPPPSMGGTAESTTDMWMVSASGSRMRVRRHELSEGVAAMWEVLSLKFSTIRTCTGQGAIELFDKLWGKNDNMKGRSCGLGFLFLYQLFQGSLRARIVSAGWGRSAWFSWFNESESEGTSDSHRFATLCAQLYTDRRSKSLLSSVINVLSRNKPLCLRLPKFRDTRKVRGTPIFNGPSRLCTFLLVE